MLKPADDAAITDLKSRLPEDTVRDVTPDFLEEPRGLYRGRAKAVVLPSTTEQVAEVVRWAATARIGIVPYGGGTGLVGGQIMSEGPAAVVLSLSRMNRIRQLHPVENVLIAEAGAILSDVHQAAESENRLFPLSLASEGSARIGGLLSTNAGGVGVLRYGNARELCLGLEAVLPDGRIWHGLKRLRKDNTGYDLRNLLIGAEGTLGVITAATLRLVPRPARSGAALMVVPDPEAALRLLTLAQDRAGHALSAFELISGQGLHFLAETMPEMRLPFETPPGWMVLIDLGMSREGSPDEVLESIFAEAHEQGLVPDGLIAQSESQRHDFWTLREMLPEGNRRIGAILSNDISLPLGAVPDFIAQCEDAIAGMGDFRINCFGHLGDGNLHFNIFPPQGRKRDEFDADLPGIKRRILDMVHEFDGSISAEHGIGRAKVDELERYGDPVKLAAMRAIKQALDPHGIMNPGAVLRQDGA